MHFYTKWGIFKTERTDKRNKTTTLKSSILMTENQCQTRAIRARRTLPRHVIISKIRKSRYLHNPDNKQTNGHENNTSLAEVI